MFQGRDVRTFLSILCWTHKIDSLEVHIGTQAVVIILQKEGWNLKKCGYKNFLSNIRLKRFKKLSNQNREEAVLCRLAIGVK